VKTSQSGIPIFSLKERHRSRLESRHLRPTFFLAVCERVCTV